MASPSCAFWYLEQRRGPRDPASEVQDRCTGWWTILDRRRQAARLSAATGLRVALIRAGSKYVPGTAVRGAALAVGLSGLLGPGRGVLAEQDPTERRGGRAGRSSYWPGAGRRVVLRGVLLQLAPACLIFSKQNNFSDSGTRPSWTFQVIQPTPELRDPLGSCLFVMLHPDLE